MRQFMSFFNDEIYEQPNVIERLLSKENKNIVSITKSLLGTFDYILIAARGSSDNAARYAQYLFGANNHFPVALATPSLFTIYKQPPVLKDALVIGISQSGQSPDIVQVIIEGKKQNRPTIAITNDLNSPLALSADHAINLNAGIEQAVAASKTYTASLVALALLSGHLMKDHSFFSELNKVPDLMRTILLISENRMARVERYRYMSHCAVIGRGMNYATSFEIALKIKELTHVVAEPYSSADFRHGPIAMVHEGFPIIMIAPSGGVLLDVKDLAFDVLRRKSEIVMISDNEELLELANLPLPIPEKIPEWLSPILCILPGQLFANNLAIIKGLNPDKPSGITKITETF
jgi:glucosamine--fructose-6-phosphate aminotransferase (isomerizing)